MLRTELPKLPAQYLRRTELSNCERYNLSCRQLHAFRSELSNCEWYNLPGSELHAFGSELPNSERHHMPRALWDYAARFAVRNKNVQVHGKRSRVHEDRPELCIADGSGQDVRWGHDVRGSLPSALT